MYKQKLKNSRLFKNQKLQIVRETDNEIETDINQAQTKLEIGDRKQSWKAKS